MAIYTIKFTDTEGFETLEEKFVVSSLPDLVASTDPYNDYDKSLLKKFLHLAHRVLNRLRMRHQHICYR